MNDRYLFRAKRTDNGEWVKGLLAIMWGQFHIINPNDENTAYPIDPYTICQCTGLTDKNGQKIWENDIVRRTDLHVASESSVGFIEYDLENTSFLIHWTDKVEYSPTYHWKDRLEVIGNIFDNPDLLEAK